MTPPGQTPAAARRPAPAATDVRPLPLGQARTLSEAELSHFRTHNESIIRGIGARLSLFLRSDFGFELDQLDALDLHRYQQSFQAPRNLVLFKAPPLAGMGVIDIPKPLALAIVDRMLGGRGLGINPDRDLKEVELALLNQAILLMVREYFQGHLPEGFEFHPQAVGREVNPRFLGIAAPETLFYSLRIEASLGDCAGQVHLLVPVDMLAPYTQKLLVAVDRETVQEACHPSTPRWNPAYGDIRLRVDACWNDIEVTPRRLIGLQVGDILPLDPRRLDDVEVRVQGLARFRGKLGSLDRKAAIEVTQKIP